MYSQAWSPVPSTTATAPLLRTAKRAPARPREQREGLGGHSTTQLRRWALHGEGPDEPPRSQARRVQQGTKIECGRPGPQQLGPAHGIVQRAQSERGQDLADLLGHEQE